MRLVRFVEFGKKIICVGRNYAAHAKELGNAVPDDKPLIFLKPATAYITQGKHIQLPPDCKELHHEIELGVVIEKPGKNIPQTSALDHVGGYVLCLDMTARDIQNKLKAKGAPWELAKAFDTSCPVGEFIPKDKVPEPENVQLWCKVNGQQRQDGESILMMVLVLLPSDCILSNDFIPESSFSE